MTAGASTDLHVCLVMEGHPLVQMGGAEYQAHQLAEELCRRDGVRVTYLARTAPDVADLPYQLRSMGDASGFRRRSTLFDAQSLWQVLSDVHPDVIYQRMKQGYTAICAHYSRCAGVPLVFHAASDPDTDGRWLRKPWSPNTPLDLLEVAAGNWGLCRAAHVVVQTGKQGALLQRRFGREASALIPNSQPLPHELPEKISGGLRVLWVSNIKEVKRPNLFLDLADQFGHREDVEFWMVGRPGSHRSIRTTMDEIRRSTSISYFGELSLERVNELMAQADVFVNTSSFEGFPNTFIQAWGRGAIVTSLAVDVDGGMEARGIGYCTGNLARMAEVIRRLADSPDLRREISERAFAHAWQEHSCANLERLADFVLGVGRGQPSGRAAQQGLASARASSL
jgi:glycosyltransferase involved in cell wall biosynthesis